jgi:hypothetical protein
MTSPQRGKPSSRSFASVTITSAADGLSEAVNLTGLTLSAIQMSTAWTAASIGFQATVNGSTDFFNVYDTAGNFLTYPTSANRIVAFDPAVFAGLQQIKLVSETTAGVAVAQGAGRLIQLGLAEYVTAN